MSTISPKQIAYIGHLMVERGIAKRFDYGDAKQFIAKQMGNMSYLPWNAPMSWASDLIDALKNPEYAFEPINQD